MKKVVALLLIVAFVLSIGAGVTAAVPDDSTVPSVELMNSPKTREQKTVWAASDEILSQKQDVRSTPIDGNANWIYPYYHTYGQATVIGWTMELKARVCDDSLGWDGKVGVLIYKGKYDEIADNSEIVAGGYQKSASHPSYSAGFDWDTTGMTAGDYTAIFFLMQGEGTVVFASVADLYLSDKSIPMTGVELLVHELNGTPDDVYVHGGDDFSVNLVYEPYHTTANRAFRWRDETVSGSGILTTRSAGIPGTQNISTDRDSAVIKLTLYTEYATNVDGVSFSDTINVHVGEWNDKIHFQNQESGEVICGNVTKTYTVNIPSDVTQYMVMTTNPAVLEIVSVVGNQVSVRTLGHASSSNTGIVVSANGCFDLLRIRRSNSHDWYIEKDTHPTCTEPGIKKMRCSACDETLSETVPALGHDYDESTSVTLSEPTATKDGLRQVYCNRCKKTIDDIIPRIFTDTKSDSYYSEAVDYCYENDIIKGITESTFGPKTNVTRAMLVTMLYRYDGSAEVEGESVFSDVPANKYYTDAVIWANQNGIVTGYDGGIFRPQKSITREQLVTILFRYAAFLGKDNGQRADLSAYEDLEDAGAYAVEALQWAVGNGIMSGISKTAIGPRGQATRAQTATFLYRFIQYVENYVEPEVPTEPAEPTEPTEPVEPTDPVEPTEPEEPTDPVEPTEPEEPTDPIEPTEPEEPTDPA